MTVEKKPPRTIRLQVRWLVVGVVVLALVVGAVIVGVVVSSPDPGQLFIAAQREATVASYGEAVAAEKSDEVALQALDNACDSGESIDSLITRDPRYLPRSMTREQYVGLAEEYCASRR